MSGLLDLASEDMRKAANPLNYFTDEYVFNFLDDLNII